MTAAATLQVSTPTDREIVVTRDIGAPRHLVFDAWTKPELVRRWMLGPDGWTMVVCEIDLLVGGSYRFVMRNVQGTEMGWGGVYREIQRPDRLVATELFDEAWYPGEALITNTLVEHEGTTTLTITMLFESQEAREAALSSGMEAGMAASFDRLAQVLVSIGQGS